MVSEQDKNRLLDECGAMIKYFTGDEVFIFIGPSNKKFIDDVDGEGFGLE